MIDRIDLRVLFNVMMIKLSPFLSQKEVSDELFIIARKCVDLILRRLYVQRNIDFD